MCLSCTTSCGITVASLWQSFVGVLTLGRGLVGHGVVNPNHTIGESRPCEHSWDHDLPRGGPSMTRVPVDPRVSPRGRAGPE